MSDIDLFIQTLQEKTNQCKKAASSGKNLSDYYQGKAEAYKEVAVELKKGFSIDCRYMVINKGKSLDGCQVKKYCDPRNCSIKEPVQNI